MKRGRTSDSGENSLLLLTDLFLRRLVLVKMYSFAVLLTAKPLDTLQQPAGGRSPTQQPSPPRKSSCSAANGRCSAVHHPKASTSLGNSQSFFLRTYSSANRQP